MEGSAFPLSILLIYPAFWPRDRLISRAEHPFNVCNCESRKENCSSYVQTPFLEYFIVNNSQMCFSFMAYAKNFGIG